MDEDKCYHVGYVSVHHCIDGVTLNTGSAKDGYDATNIILAENKINIKLHTGSTAIIHNSFLKNTFISSLTRATCTDCYS